MSNNEKTIRVASEVGRLRKLLIHRPDGVIGRIIPEKAEEWLYDDIVFSDKMRWEYYHYILLLLFFLDKAKIDEDIAKEKESVILDFLATPFYLLTENKEKRERLYNFFNPNPTSGSKAYHNSKYVLDVMVLLRDLLNEDEYPGMKSTIVTSVCILEGISDKKRVELMQRDPIELVKTLVCGDELIKDRTGGERKHRTLFAPVPNLIFTRDIGVVTNDHILITNAAKRARQRESLFVKYIFKYHNAFSGKDEVNENVLELADDEVNLDKDLFFVQDAEETDKPKDTENEPKIAVEGGDVMMVNGKYLLIGTSERTNAYAVKRIAKEVFERNTGIEKVISVQIPKNRSSMHLDTIMTQVDRYDWVIYKPFIGDKPTKTTIYDKKNFNTGARIEKQTITQTIEREIYEKDTEKARFIYCGNGEFPYDRREQWTDGANLVALMPGVCIGYDRNTKTADAFREKGYEVYQTKAFLYHVIKNNLTADDFVNKKALLLLPSGELSRARGGSHCMSMPLLRDDL